MLHWCYGYLHEPKHTDHDGFTWGDAKVSWWNIQIYFQVNTFKIMDCNKAHYDKEIVQWVVHKYSAKKGN